MVHDIVARETLAKGIRFLLRSQPVEEQPPEGGRRDYEPPITQDFPHSWLDAVPEGQPHQVSVEVFVDLDEVAILIEGLAQLIEAGERWVRIEASETAEWMEAVYAWNDELVF